MKFAVYSLGCKVNAYEGNAIKALFLNKKYEENNLNPDAIVINTCSVTATADQKSRQLIRRLRRKHPQSIIAVMGCYSQHAYDFICKELDVDIVLGSSKRDQVVDLIEEFAKTKQKISLVEDNNSIKKYDSFGVTSYSENVRAYLKIQDGCDNYCSYCLIPYIRGRMRSRPKEETLIEASELAKKYKEIVLVGIHVAGYGKDLDNYTFDDLLEDIINKNKDLYKLRISSIEESEIDDRFISLLKKYNTIASHLHIPLQSGSSSVLKRMNRKYDTKAFLEKIEKIKKEIPLIALSTDVIVGFPGESEEEFNETYNFIKQVGFMKLHVFPFSSRVGTKASRMPNQIDEITKAKRVKLLLELSNELEEDYKMKFIDKEVSVLIEEYNREKDVYIGHTSNYLKVEIKSSENIINQIVKTTITKHCLVK